MAVIAVALVSTNYGRLADQPLDLVLCLLLLAVFVGFTEESPRGPQAIAQAALRAGSVIFLPMFVHGLWDFSLFSSLAGQPDPKVYFGMGLIILLQIVLIVVLVVRRHRIEPA